MTDPLYQAADCALEIKLGLRRIDSIFSKAGSPIYTEQPHISSHRSSSSSKRRKVNSLIHELVNDHSRDASDAPDPSTCAIAAHCSSHTAPPASSPGYNKKHATADDPIGASALTTTTTTAAAGKKATSGRGKCKGRARSGGVQSCSQLTQANFKSYFVR